MRPDMEVFLQERRSWLLRRAQGLCRTKTDAEDLVQETFTRFLTSFGPASPLPDENICASWLISTMTNCFYDQLRRQRTRDRGANELAREMTAEPTVRSLYERISDEQFASAIQALSPRIRSTMEMHAQGRKYHEIASELGIPSGTVAKRLHLGRAKLRSLLEPLLQQGDH